MFLCVLFFSFLFFCSASAESVAVGKTVTVSVSGAKGTISYKSSDTSIATVTSAGKVTAKKVGTVKITATSAATSTNGAASKTVTIKVVPAATSSLKATNLATGIKLTWAKVAGATGYKVYRGKTPIATIRSGAKVTFTDSKANTNGAKYTFRVIATASTGTSTLSKSVTKYRIARPVISSATNNASGKITVKWEKNAKATGYQLQYSKSSSFASGNKKVNISSAGTVSKAISGLKKDSTYYVRIRSYKTVGNAKYYSGWSSKKTVKITVGPLSDKAKAISAYKKMLSNSTIAMMPLGTSCAYWGDGETVYRKASSTSGMSFALAYIDNDDVPELIIKTRDNLIDTWDNKSKIPYYLQSVYTWKNGKVSLIAYRADEGEETPLFRGYYKKKGIFKMRDYYLGGYDSKAQLKMYTDCYYKLSGNRALLQLTSSHCGNSAMYYAGEDNEISKSTFQSKLKAATGGIGISTVTFRKNTKGNRDTYLK